MKEKGDQKYSGAIKNRVMFIMPCAKLIPYIDPVLSRTMAKINPIAPAKKQSKCHGDTFPR